MGFGYGSLRGGEGGGGGGGVGGAVKGRSDGESFQPGIRRIGESSQSSFGSDG